MIDFTKLTSLCSANDCTVEAIIPDGWNKPNGYILHGPRGRKTVVSVDAQGDVDEFIVNMWLDTVKYGNLPAWPADKKARR